MAIIGLLFIVLLFNTVRFTSKQRDVAPVDLIEVDRNVIAARLSDAVKLKTISNQALSEFDPTATLQLHQYLEKSFPRVHETLEKSVINQFSLLYKWQGSNPAQQPIILMAHMDVVPIEPSSAPPALRCQLRDAP